MARFSEKNYQKSLSSGVMILRNVKDSGVMVVTRAATSAPRYVVVPPWIEFELTKVWGISEIQRSNLHDLALSGSFDIIIPQEVGQNHIKTPPPIPVDIPPRGTKLEKKPEATHPTPPHLENKKRPDKPIITPQPTKTNVTKKLPEPQTVLPVTPPSLPVEDIKSSEDIEDIKVPEEVVGETVRLENHIAPGEQMLDGDEMGEEDEEDLLEGAQWDKKKRKKHKHGRGAPSSVG